MPGGTLNVHYPIVTQSNLISLENKHGRYMGAALHHHDLAGAACSSLEK